jgi:hypothetical protein
VCSWSAPCMRLMHTYNARTLSLTSASPLSRLIYLPAASSIKPNTLMCPSTHAHTFFTYAHHQAMGPDLASKLFGLLDLDHRISVPVLALPSSPPPPPHTHGAPVRCGHSSHSSTTQSQQTIAQSHCSQSQHTIASRSKLQPIAANYSTPSPDTSKLHPFILPPYSPLPSTHTLTTHTHVCAQVWPG